MDIISSIFSFVNLGEVTPLDAVLVMMVVWVRRDLSLNTKALNNGLVTKMETVRAEITLLFSKLGNIETAFLSNVAESKKACADHREAIRELIRAKMDK